MRSFTDNRDRCPVFGNGVERPTWALSRPLNYVRLISVINRNPGFQPSRFRRLDGVPSVGITLETGSFLIPSAIRCKQCRPTGRYRLLQSIVTALIPTKSRTSFSFSRTAICFSRNKFLVLSRRAPPAERVPHSRFATLSRSRQGQRLPRLHMGLDPSSASPAPA